MDFEFCVGMVKKYNNKVNGEWANERQVKTRRGISHVHPCGVAFKIVKHLIISGVWAPRQAMDFGSEGDMKESGESY